MVRIKFIFDGKRSPLVRNSLIIFYDDASCFAFQISQYSLVPAVFMLSGGHVDAADGAGCRRGGAHRTDQSHRCPPRGRGTDNKLIASAEFLSGFVGVLKD